MKKQLKQNWGDTTRQFRPVFTGNVYHIKTLERWLFFFFFPMCIYRELYKSISVCTKQGCSLWVCKLPLHWLCLKSWRIQTPAALNSTHVRSIWTVHSRNISTQFVAVLPPSSSPAWKPGSWLSHWNPISHFRVSCAHTHTGRKTKYIGNNLTWARLTWSRLKKADRFLFFVYFFLMVPLVVVLWWLGVWRFKKRPHFSSCANMFNVDDGVWFVQAAYLFFLLFFFNVVSDLSIFHVGSGFIVRMSKSVPSVCLVIIAAWCETHLVNEERTIKQHL